MLTDFPDRRAVLVLGMHRSGTSALSRVVNLLGAAAPVGTMPPGPDNPRGFWGPEAIVRLNDEVLAAGGSSWADWTRFDADRLAPTTVTAFRPRMAAALRAAYGDAPLFVLKDPRLSRLLPLWGPTFAALGTTPFALIALRHPAAVARSLAARDGFPQEMSLLLWLRHVLDAERVTRGMARDFVSYNALLADWRGTMARAAARLGVGWRVSMEAAAADVDAFLDEGLRHERAEALASSSAYAEVWTRHAWQALCALEQSGPAEAPLAALDRVRGQFEDACRLFAPAIRRRERSPNLRAVTLCAADSYAVPLTARAMRASAERCRFGDAVLFTDAPTDASRQSPFRTQAIAPLRSRAAYSAFVLRGLAPHVTTSHVLIVQWDGWVADAAAWDPELLSYDYAGAPWGRYSDGMDVGNGGFSLRSRRLLDALQDERFAPVPAVPEDELIGRVWRPALERDYGIRFAPPDVAARFAYERVLPQGATFGFHGLFNFWRHVDDAGLEKIAALLPGAALRGREFAELVALCFLARRHGALRLLGEAWQKAVAPQAIQAALLAILKSEDSVAQCMGRAGLGAPPRWHASS